jgi:hypothetical protein
VKRVFCLLLPAAALLAPPVLATGPSTPPDLSDRSHELLDYTCANDLGERRVTLFGNGTVRVRDGLGGKTTMTLGEIPPDRMEGYVRRLGAEDLTEVDETRLGPEGSWVEHCRVILSTGDRPRRYDFGRYDSLPMALAALVRVADEVAAHALPLDQLPSGYQPRKGDVLRRVDGAVFEIVAFSAVGQGIELSGRDQPLTLYVRPDELRGLFDALLSRRAP